MTREVKSGNKQVNKTTDEREESNYRRADEAIAGHFNEQIVEYRAAQKTAIVRRCHVTTAARRAHPHTHTRARMRAWNSRRHLSDVASVGSPARR